MHDMSEIYNAAYSNNHHKQLLLVLSNILYTTNALCNLYLRIISTQYSDSRLMIQGNIIRDIDTDTLMSLINTNMTDWFTNKLLILYNNGATMSDSISIVWLISRYILYIILVILILLILLIVIGAYQSNQRKTRDRMNITQSYHNSTNNNSTGHGLSAQSQRYGFSRPNSGNVHTLNISQSIKQRISPAIHTSIHNNQHSNNDNSSHNKNQPVTTDYSNSSDSDMSGIDGTNEQLEQLRNHARDNISSPEFNNTSSVKHSKSKHIDILQIVDELEPVNKKTKLNKRNKKSMKRDKHNKHNIGAPNQDGINTGQTSDEPYIPPLQLDSRDSTQLMYNELYSLIHVCIYSRTVRDQQLLLHQLIDDELQRHNIQQYQADLLKRFIQHSTKSQLRTPVSSQSLYTRFKSMIQSINILQHNTLPICKLIPTMYNTPELSGLVQQCIELRQSNSSLPSTLQYEYDTELTNNIIQYIKQLNDKYSKLQHEQPLSIATPANDIDTTRLTTDTAIHDDSLFVSPNQYNAHSRKQSLNHTQSLIPNILSPIDTNTIQSTHSHVNKYTTPHTLHRINSINAPVLHTNNVNITQLISPINNRVQRSYSSVDTNNHRLIEYNSILNGNRLKSPTGKHKF